MPDVSDLICIAAITGAFGVHGEVRLKSFCAAPGDVEKYSPLTTGDGSREFTVELSGRIKNGFAARLGGVATREQADALRGVRLYVPRDRLPSLPDDEYYYSDLIGLEVFDTGGARLGRVKTVANHGAADLLEIDPGTGDTVLLPFTREAVPTVDIRGARIVADPPDGLF